MKITVTKCGSSLILFLFLLIRALCLISWEWMIKKMYLIGFMRIGYIVWITVCRLVNGKFALAKSHFAWAQVASCFSFLSISCGLHLWSSLTISRLLLLLFKRTSSENNCLGLGMHILLLITLIFFIKHFNVIDIITE